MQKSSLDKPLEFFDLNPVLYCELILKQQYDKVLNINDSTVIYNLEILVEHQIH